MDTLGELGQHSTMEPTNQVSTFAIWTPLIAQSVKNLPAMQETPVRFLGWEDPLERRKGYPLLYSWASFVAQLVKNPPRRPGFNSWVGKIS